MKINYIKLCNISSYSDECFFDFTVSDDRNIILIGGQNGTGKTSLFTALKLGLYGHLCFNYQSSSSPMYLSKIKDIINHDAFTTKEIVAYVEVELEIPKERDYVKYIIKREWRYEDKKIKENFIVFNNNKALKNNEIVFFQNYLFTILPPNLFDFFFFDGEEIADFFASNSYNLYIKKAILSICSFDTFELIRKFSNNYVDNSSEEDENTVLLYKDILNKIENRKLEIEKSKEQSYKIEKELYDIIDRKEYLSNKFKNSGGLTEDEKDKLFESSREQEKIKNECSLRIKNFVEGMMPFIISKEFANKIEKQLSLENEYQKYNALNDKLNSNVVNEAIFKTINKYKIDSIDESFISELVNSISLAVKPSINEEKFSLIHDLSNEQNTKVFSVLNYVNKFSEEGILKVINIKDSASSRTVEINKQLREAMSDIDSKKYSDEFEKLAQSEFEKNKLLENLNFKIYDLEKEIQELYYELNKIRLQLEQDAKNRNIYMLTNKVSKLFDNVINRLTVSKFKEIEKYMLIMLNKIMRKDNFIDLVELDENFNINIYKEQIYKKSDLENLIKNIGTDELLKRLGTSGIQKLLEEFDIDSINKLKSNLQKNHGQIGLDSENIIKLYKRLDFNQLSKGEKQIFILSLYYAIIKVSGKNIPFIIDTPYARIDTEHREQISTVFFPEISGQVIILSTDEEITLPYYKVLKPFINKEYLLTYDELNSKTTVSNGYFYKE